MNEIDTKQMFIDSLAKAIDNLEDCVRVAYVNNRDFTDIVDYHIRELRCIKRIVESNRGNNVDK